jgi:3-isopropylmalate/(R)-2-methylmalate dehydratase small subunit
MEPFISIKAVAAPLPIANIDTDMLLPARFLKTVSRQGLGQALFHTQRFDADGIEKPEFILNREPWRRAGILVALDNFGCGSSREHAPWALLDFGIKCVIAPSFADIFHNNCLKNGILPVVLPLPQVEQLLAETASEETATLTVDLESQSIIRADGERLDFSIDPKKRERLLLGQDDISISLGFEPAIARHEAKARRETPRISAIPRNVGDQAKL